MVNYYSADYILPVTGSPVKNGTIAVKKGSILEIYEENSPALADKQVQRLQGVIVPGFVNCHCHLELSWLHNKTPKGSGLIPFIKEVVKTRRKPPEEDPAEAMERADRMMYKNGIVAVGDISNVIDSKAVKQKSPIYYHTFVELIGFEPDRAKDIFRAGADLFEEFKPLKASVVPHAPYSVSRRLFRFMSKFCWETGSLLSIHNQESEEENKLFRYKSGDFLDFYRDLNIDISFFKAQARNSVQSFIPLLPEKQKLLLVHNTYTSLKDIYFIKRSEREVTFCFCPNANLHIEKRLPKIEMFLHNDFNLTLGTDSLASNDNLCILSELKTLHAAFPSLELTETIKWATINGARFLEVDENLGSLEKGKKPGLNLITKMNGLSLTPESEVTKLV
ncbi:cytosine/adenosine deaminase-related metal-dependent hydrolase [Arcticibacter tournemirensis]|uniref:Amidohydrolase family protein n=1 Tax=Arcticibacter tournemirensis TaxID=699437 RepID=A0A5M9HED6_9SPHI|nr:amidohydrolase family protein [Arcticibacter tournemirensis]KAA8484695.1 amidohydrolase family protein [Arcticibacter tournemirensis]TQM47010.1 cytosine/adenosine deaminase-related metal-dependent hydrolase [Arcticibacter tournemirensis]